MKRSAKTAKVKVEAKRPVARKALESQGEVRELEKRLAEALEQRAEALEQQTATSEILRVISSSPFDLQPVFEAILSRAIGLCEGNAAVLWRFDGSHLQVAAHKNASAAGFAYLLIHRRERLPALLAGAVALVALNLAYWRYYSGAFQPPYYELQAHLFGRFELPQEHRS